MSLGARRRRPPTPGFVANELWRRAGAVPSLHLAPGRTGTAVDLITGTVLGGGSVNSATPGWETGPDGVLYQPAANTPVIGYDPVTLRPRGLRAWGVVTNQIRNNTSVGAVVGTPGTVPTNWFAPTTSNGLSRQIVGFGTLNGVDYVDIRYSGTTTAAGTTQLQFESLTAVTAAPGETWTGSIYVAIVGGELSNIATPGRIRVTGRNTAGALQETQPIDHTISSSFDRKSATATFSNANTARVSIDFIFGYNSGVAIDVTYRFGLPQLEKSAVMGPVVKTTGTAASSTADVIDITSLPVGINNIRTMYARVRTAASGNRGIISLNDNTANNRLELLSSGTDPKAVAVTSGSTVADLDGGTITANTTFAIAARFDGDSYAVSVNGGPAVTDNAGTRAIVDRIFLGRTQAGEYLNDYIEEVALWTQGVSDANLQAMNQ